MAHDPTLLRKAKDWFIKINVEAFHEEFNAHRKKAISEGKLQEFLDLGKELEKDLRKDLRKEVNKLDPDDLIAQYRMAQRNADRQRH